MSGVDVELFTAGADGEFGTADDLLIDRATTASPFVFTGVLPGEYLVDVNESTLPEGYVFTGAGATLVLVESGDVTLTEQFVHFGVNHAQVTGVVVDEDGDPLAGEEITLTAADGSTFTVTSDDDGRYVVTGSDEQPLVVGDYVVSVSVAGAGITGAGAVQVEDTDQAPELEVDTSPPPALAFTGPNRVRTFVLTGTLLILMGLLIAGATRRREEDPLAP